MSEETARSWIITLVKNNSYLTYDLFLEGKFDIDECHYASDSAVVYTYVHFKNPVSAKGIRLFLEKMKALKNILLFEVFGYDAVAMVKCTMTPSDHIGLKIIFEHYTSDNASLVSCTDGKSGLCRGFFWRSNMIARLKDALNVKHKRFIPFVENMEKELSDAREKDVTADILREQIAGYEARIETLHEHIKHLQDFEFVCHVMRWRMRNMDQLVRDALLAPDHRGQPLMPGFFDFSPEAQRQWPNSHKRQRI